MKNLHIKAIGLALLAGLMFAEAGWAASTATLAGIADWNVYGTGSQSGSGLIFGDTVGYDTSDVDGDGNPSNVWSEGTKSARQGLDYDWAVSKREFKAPLTVTWSGCLPTTRYGYNWFSIGKRDPAFTGVASSKHDPMWQGLSFMARWENQSALNVYASGKGITEVSSVTPSASGFCGDFKIVWRDKLAQFYFNNTKINEQAFSTYYDEPVILGFRSFEKAITVSSFTVTEEDAVAAAPSAALSLSKLEFGSQKLGIATTPQSLKLTNSGTAALVVGSVSASLSDFEVTTNCSGNLAAGASCDIYVKFSPLATGSRGATLTVASNNPAGAVTLSLSGTGSATQDYMGAMLGQIVAQVVDESGKTVTPSCSSSVDVSVSDGGSGGLGATAIGTVVCDAGVIIKFTLNYDAATLNLSGTYSDNVGNTGQTIKFTNTGGLTWQALATGTAARSGGVRSYSASITITLPPQALYASQYPASGKLSGPIRATNPISIPLNIPELGINQTLSFNIVVEGSWSAKVVPTASGGAEVTGEVSGSVKGDQAIHLVGKVDPTKYGAPAGIPVIDVPVDIDINETFSGTLFGNIALNNLKFKGYFTQQGKPVSFEMAIPLDTGTLPTQMSFSMGGSMPVGIPSGSIPSYIPSSLVPSSVALPTTLGNGLVPFEISQ